MGGYGGGYGMGGYGRGGVSVSRYNGTRCVFLHTDHIVRNFLQLLSMAATADMEWAAWAATVAA